MKDIFNAIIEADARILEDVQHMKNKEETEIKKFNKMLDSFYLGVESSQF